MSSETVPSTPPPATTIPIPPRRPLRQANSSASLQLDSGKASSSFSSRLPLSFDVDGIPHFSSTMTTPPHSPSLRGASRLARRSGSLGGTGSPSPPSSGDMLSLGSMGLPPVPPNTGASGDHSFEGMDKKTAEKALRAMEEEQEAVTLSLLKRLETLNEEKASIARTLESDSIKSLLHHQPGRPASPLCTPSSPLGPFASSLPASPHQQRHSPPTLHLTPKLPAHPLPTSHASVKTPTLSSLPKLPGAQAHDLTFTLREAAAHAEGLARRVEQLEKSALECWKYAESMRREVVNLSGKLNEPVIAPPLPPHPLSHAYSTPTHPARGRGATITSSTASPSSFSVAAPVLRSGSGTHLGVGLGATVNEGSPALKGLGAVAAAGPSWRTAEMGQLGRRESVGPLGENREGQEEQPEQEQVDKEEPELEKEDEEA